MSYTKAEQLYEGKAKKVFAIKENPDYVMVSYKDDATAFNGLKKGQIHGKGVINNKMTNYMFSLLEKEGIPTHLVEEINDRETVVKKVEIVPLEVIVRNVAAGSFSKKLGIEEGTPSRLLPSSSATRTTTSAIRSSTATTHSAWVLLPRRRSTPSPSMLSR